MKRRKTRQQAAEMIERARRLGLRVVAEKQLPAGQYLHTIRRGKEVLAGPDGMQVRDVRRWLDGYEAGMRAARPAGVRELVVRLGLERLREMLEEEER